MMKSWMKYGLGFFLFYAALLLMKREKHQQLFKRQWPKKKWILGHRGARADAPENTLTAFQKAMVYGADGVEFDVFLSKDGVPVVIHDETVDRTTGRHGFVWNFTAKELSELNAAKDWAGFNKEGIPTLEQSLEILPQGAIVNVELKSGGAFAKQEVIEKLLPVLKKHQQRLILIISSFDGELLFWMRLMAPQYLLSLLLSPQDKNWPDSLQYFNLIQPDALHLPRQLAHPLIRKLAKQKQVHLAIWTVNNKGQASNWFHKGIDGIVTDNVSEIVQIRPNIST